MAAAVGSGIKLLERLNDQDFVSLMDAPWRIYQAYQVDRRDSDLARIFSNALRIQSAVDAVVIVCDSAQRIADQMFLSACSQPYWNELTRAERGCRPRVYHVDHVADNDQIQSLLHRLGRDSQSADPTMRDWCLVIHHPANVSRFDAFRSPASRLLWNELQRHCNSLEKTASKFLVEFIDDCHLSSGQDSDCCFNATCSNETIFDAPGLFAAALVGINVIELLGGAHAITESVRRTVMETESEVTQPKTAALQLADSILHLQKSHQCDYRVELETPNAAARSLADWISVTSTDVELNQRTLSLVAEIEENRCDPLQLTTDERDSLCFTSIYADAIERWLRERDTGKTPTGVLRLHKLDELHVGQVVQCFLIALHLSKRATNH